MATTINVPSREPTVLSAVGVLLRARLLIAKNTYWRGKAGRKIGLLIFVAVIGFAGWGLFWLTRGAVRVITSPEFTETLARAARQTPNLPRDFRPYLLSLPSLLFFMALLLLIFTSFSSVLAALYLSGDIDMLVVAPVPMRSVFVVKFFSGLLVPYCLLFLLLGPALLGYGQGMRFGPAFFAAAIVTLVLFPLLPAGVGALLVMAVVRVIPARRARDIVGALGGLFGVAWYVFTQLSNEVTRRYANIRTLNSLRRLDISLLPSAWAGRALNAAGQAAWPALALYGGIFLALSVVVFAGCLLLAERLYYVGWSNMANQGGRVRRRRRAVEAALPPDAVVARRPRFKLLDLIPRESRAILAKDLRVFPRELRNFQQMLFPLAMAGFWVFRIMTGQGLAGHGPEAGLERFMNTAGMAGVSFFICTIFSGALSGSGVNREGRGYWLLRVAPVSPQRLLLGKLLLAYLPFPVVGTILIGLFSITQHSSPGVFARALLLVLLVGLGTSAISVGLGATFPKLNWENPNQQRSLRAVIFGAVGYLCYLALAGIVALGVPFFGRFVPHYATALTVLSWGLLIALTAGVVWLTMSVGAARLGQMDVV